MASAFPALSISRSKIRLAVLHTAISPAHSPSIRRTVAKAVLMDDLDLNGLAVRQPGKRSYQFGFHRNTLSEFNNLVELFRDSPVT